MKNVAGIFYSKYEADQAVATLLNDGFTRDSISILMTGDTKNKLFSSTDDEETRVAKGGIAGATVGGTLGGLLAGLAAVGSITIPGVALLGVGPIMAILSGVGAGAIAGGFSGALIQSGFAADEANRFEEEIKAGKVVVIVHPHTDAETDRARAALNTFAAETKVA